MEKHVYYEVGRVNEHGDWDSSDGPFWSMVEATEALERTIPAPGVKWEIRPTRA